MGRSLFAGWMPDAAGRERLGRLAAALQAARPAGMPALKLRRADQWHATLCFIARGFDEAVATRAATALAPVAARIPPHAIAIDRIEYWSGPSVFVVVPAPDPVLQALCDACAVALRHADVGPVQRTTQPHVTLAYADRHLPPQDWLAGIACAGATLRVDRFQLLFNPGGRYEALGDWPLAGGPLAAAPDQPALF